MWDMKELMQLRDNLRQLYDKSKRRIKIFKRDLKKIDYEMESKHYLPNNKKRKLNANENSASEEDDVILERYVHLLKSLFNVERLTKLDSTVKR